MLKVEKWKERRRNKIRGGNNKNKYCKVSKLVCKSDERKIVVEGKNKE
jgi:hypothetical protein